jgi:hypothetical protein
VDLGDLVVSDPGQDIAEPGLRIHVIEPGGFDQGVGDGGGMSSALGACKQPDEMTV